MELYSLESNSYNEGIYEHFDSFDMFYGVFSTIEKAKEYAEKRISTIKRKYRIDEDWSEDEFGNYEKRLIIEEDKPAYCCDDEYDINYTILKRKLDPEYKED